MNDDERLTEEELRCMVDDDKLFDEYDMKNMYCVMDDVGEKRKCPDCGLPKTDENKHLFYNYKYTRCIVCSKRYSRNYAKQNREKIKLYSREYRLKRKQLDNYGEY